MLFFLVYIEQGSWALLAERFAQIQRENYNTDEMARKITKIRFDIPGPQTSW
jgi:hypothetical protein